MQLLNMKRISNLAITLGQVWSMDSTFLYIQFNVQQKVYLNPKKKLRALLPKTPSHVKYNSRRYLIQDMSLK